MRPAVPPLIACVCALLGLFTLAAAFPEPAAIEPIPLRAAAIATPVGIVPTTPPIRNAPPFVSTRKQPEHMPNHRDILLRWYMPEKIDVSPGMH
jgi:hypothetical protein